MPAAPELQDRRLCLDELLPALTAHGMLDNALAERLRRTPGNGLHPLELLANQSLPDPARPGMALSLEQLTQWLASHVGQPYLRIDPLKIDVASMVPLMSHAFAQRHHILAVALDRDSVTVAGAEPYLREWEAGLAHVLKRSIKRVLANPPDDPQLYPGVLPAGPVGQRGRPDHPHGGPCRTTAAPGCRRPGARCQRCAHRQHCRLVAAICLRPTRQRYPYRTRRRPGPRALPY